MRPRRSSLAAVLLAAGAFRLGAQDVETEARGAAFLLVPVGGRAVALGQAAVADGGSSEAAFWNPAGLARLTRSEIALHHARTFASNNTVLGGYVSAAEFGVFGVAAYLVDFGAQEVSVGPGLPIGRISPKNIEVVASYATDLVRGMAVGVNYKLIQFRQDCAGSCEAFPTAVGTTHGIDVGIQYAVGAGERLRVGAAVLHVGFPLQVNNRDQADPLPTQVQVGGAYQLALPRRDSTAEPVDLRVLVDLRDRWGNYDDPETRVGLEVGYGDIVRLRSGYAFLHSEASGPSIGFGVQLGRVVVDFARQFFLSSNLDEPVYLTLRARF